MLVTSKSRNTSYDPIYGDFPQRLWRGVRIVLSDLSGVGSNPTVSTFIYAVCPGGEGAALKAVGLKGLAGSNPVDGARAKAPTAGPLCR